MDFCHEIIRALSPCRSPVTSLTCPSSHTSSVSMNLWLLVCDDPCDDPFVAMWMKIIEAAGRLAAEHDRTWMRRRRVLNSLIVMLFVFRLVLSRNSKGYATVVAELWD